MKTELYLWNPKTNIAWNPKTNKLATDYHRQVKTHDIEPVFKYVITEEYDFKNGC